MQSNKYVYPYTPFADLNNKEQKAKWSEDRIVSMPELKELVNKLPALKVNMTGESVEEKILNLFMNEELLFGPSEYINDMRGEWISRLKVFTTNNETLALTILGFPFKMPVPLKTDRILPDLGEVMSMKRLLDITTAIKSVYEPGAVITIFTEGVFGRFNSIPEIEYKQYKDRLSDLAEELGWREALKFVELEEMEKLDENFTERFEVKVKELRSLYESKDSAFMEKYNGARESILRIANTKELEKPLAVLMDAYNDNILPARITDEVKAIRKHIETQSHEMLLQYHAYLKIRDELDFIEKIVPNAITLSVSPKPGRLGIIPLNSDCIRLPYHAVPVIWKSGAPLTLEYLIDIQRMSSTFRKVMLAGDPENKAFYYEQI